MKKWPLLTALLLLSTASTFAGKAPCSIHSKKGTTSDELAALAKISQADAQKAALASLDDPSKATVKESELESEHGCLIYSFDIEVAGKTGIQEVQIDAGNGKVLSTEHETRKDEAAEKAKDKSGKP